MQLSPQREEGIENIEWIPIGEAIQIVGFENLIVVLDRFQKWMA